MIIRKIRRTLLRDSMMRTLYGLLALGLPLLAGAMEPVAVNVGASQFTLFWDAGIIGEPEVIIFDDPGLGVEVTSEYRREAFPSTEPPQPHWNAGRRADHRAFQASIRSRGLMLLRITGLEPDTVYYVQAGVRDGGGNLHPAGSGPVVVRTLPETGFVVDYRKAAFTFPDAAEAGSIAVMSVPGTAAPLLAVVGDGLGPADQAVFSLGGLVDATTGAPYQPSGPLSFEVSHYPGLDEARLMAGSLEVDGGFSVASLTTRTFELTADVDIAYFVFDAVEDQLAGRPFMVRITARTSSGEIASDFEESVDLFSDGRLEAGATGATFSGGVLEAHPVLIGNTGDFFLATHYAATGASGESNSFRVTTDWENWASLHGVGQDGESRREALLSDPRSTGVPAFVRYAFDLDYEHPSLADARALDVTEEEGMTFAQITFRRLQYAPDVRYVVSGSSDLQDWETLAVVEPGSPEWVTVEDAVPLQVDGDGRFLRVGVVGDGGYEFWKVSEFSPAEIDDPGISGPEADPGSIGVENLTRYALGMSATDPDLNRLPDRSVVVENGQQYNRLGFHRRPYADDVRYVVEATSAYPTWETLAILEPGLPEAVSVTDTTPVPSSGYRIIRLRVEPVSEP